MSIQALKESLPELSEEALERTYRQFAIRALAPVLGYDESRPRGLTQSWDEILDLFAAERERRRVEKEAQKPTETDWEGFCKGLSDCQPRRRKRNLDQPQNPG